MCPLIGQVKDIVFLKDSVKTNETIDKLIIINEFKRQLLGDAPHRLELFQTMLIENKEHLQKSRVSILFALCTRDYPYYCQ